MKLYILFITVLCAGSSLAQIVLGPERLITPGDQMILWQMDTTNVNEGSAGANQIWDFSGLESIDALSMEFVDALTTPYHSQFPDASVAGVVSEGEIASYTFYSTNENKIYSLGTSSGGFSAIYNDVELTAFFPFTYNSSFTDYYEGITDMGEGMISYKTGDVLVTADAYGAITFPDGSTDDALRIKTIRSSIDSLFEGENFIGESSYNTITYSWVTNNSKYPVFSISYISIGFLGTVSELKSVDFSPQEPTDVNDENAAHPDNFKLEQNFPNPFNPITKISFSLTEKSFVSLKVYNAIGKEVAVLSNEEKEAGEHTIDFNASELSAGVYFYTLASGNFKETKKMILLK